MIARRKKGKVGVARVRGRAALRAERFLTWEALIDAVRALCRQEVQAKATDKERILTEKRERIRAEAKERIEAEPDQNEHIQADAKEKERKLPERFDLATWEPGIRRQARGLANKEPVQHFEALRDALLAADDYLASHPQVLADRNMFARALEFVLSARLPVPPLACTPTLREHLRSWRRGPLTRREERHLLRRDPHVRVHLVRLFCGCNDDLWWQGTPTTRDLTMLTLLAGCEPPSAKGLQENAVGADRPTARDVIEAERKAVAMEVSRLGAKSKSTTRKSKV